MKKFILIPLCLGLLFSIIITQQPEKSIDIITMCGPAEQQFAAFGSDPLFVKKHLNPEPFDTFQSSGEMVNLKVEGQDQANAYTVKSPTATTDYLFVIHEWWGLNNYVKQESDRFAKELGINVLALDLYDGKVAENSEDAAKYMQGMSADRARSIIGAASLFTGTDSRIYTIGWCFGGGWSLQTAMELGEKAKGCIMFYGMPESDLSRLSTLQCDVLGLFAANEKWITPEVVSTFEANMKSLGKNLKVKSYNAEHAFANPSNPRYNKAAADDAYKLVYEFIKARR